MSSANDISFQNPTFTKRPTQTHFYPGEISSGPCNTNTTSNETLQGNLYGAYADEGQMPSNNVSHNSSYEGIVSPNRHGDSFRDRALQSQFYDSPCFLQTSKDISSTKRNNLTQDRPYKLPDRYSYNHVPSTNLYNRYTAPYTLCRDAQSTHEVSRISPYNVCTDQTNSTNILRCPYNSYADQCSHTNISQASPYNKFTNQRAQSNAYKTCPEQRKLRNTLQNNFYDVFHQNTSQTDPYNNMYLDQRDINRSTESNSRITYKQDVSQTDVNSNANTNQWNSLRGHPTQTIAYNARMNQTSTNNGSQTYQYNTHYADCFKYNNVGNTAPHNNFYRTYSDPCPTATNPTLGANFYDSYTVPFSIELSHPTSQFSPRTHHHQSPRTPLSATRPRNRFSRQKWTSRRLDFPDSDLDNQSQQYVVVQQFVPEIYYDAKQPEGLPQHPQVSPKTMKRTTNELPAVATMKNKHRSVPQRISNAPPKSTVGPGRKIERPFHSLISRQDVLLSSRAIDEDDDDRPVADACLKKKGRPLKKISSRPLKCASKPFRDAGKSRTKKSLKWGKRPSEKVTPKTETDTSSLVDVYLWADDFSLEEVNDVDHSPSSLFLRPKSSDFFENDRKIIQESDFEESEWPRSICQLEIDDLKPAWKILMLEPIFPSLIQ